MLRIRYVQNYTHSIAQPIFKLLTPVAVMYGNAFPLDHQLVLQNQK